MALVSCWSCGSDGNVQVFCPPRWNGEEYAGGGWISVPTPDEMDGTDCDDCRARLRKRHCPAHYATYESNARRTQSPIGGGMRSATGEKGICGTDKQLTLHSLSIGIGAVAGFAFIPNKFMGVVGGMVAGGVVGGLILKSACK